MKDLAGANYEAKDTECNMKILLLVVKERGEVTITPFHYPDKGDLPDPLIVAMKISDGLLDPEADCYWEIITKEELEQIPDMSSNHIKCHCVEYDFNYYGGDYKETGEFLYIPHKLIDKIHSFQTEGTSYDEALMRTFEFMTGKGRQHIVSYNVDETVDQYGNYWE